MPVPWILWEFPFFRDPGSPSENGFMEPRYWYLAFRSDEKDTPIIIWEYDWIPRDGFFIGTTPHPGDWTPQSSYCFFIASGLSEELQEEGSERQVRPSTIVGFPDFPCFPAWHLCLFGWGVFLREF